MINDSKDAKDSKDTEDSKEVRPCSLGLQIEWLLGEIAWKKANRWPEDALTEPLAILNSLMQLQIQSQIQNPNPNPNPKVIRAATQRGTAATPTTTTGNRDGDLYEKARRLYSSIVSHRGIQDTGPRYAYNAAIDDIVSAFSSYEFRLNYEIEQHERTEVEVSKLTRERNDAQARIDSLRTAMASWRNDYDRAAIKLAQIYDWIEKTPIVAEEYRRFQRRKNSSEPEAPAPAPTPAPAPAPAPIQGRREVLKRLLPLAEKADREAKLHPGSYSVTNAVSELLILIRLLIASSDPE